MDFIKTKYKQILVLILGVFVVGTVYAQTLTENEPLDSTLLSDKYDVATDIKDKYDLEATILTTKIDHIDDVKVKIGEADEFVPNMEISRWDGEVKMKLKPRLDEKSKIKTLDFENEKIKYKEDKMEYHLYEIENTKTNELFYEFEVILLEKPDSNVITFDIETEGLDFSYQSALDEKYPLSENCSPTECDTDEDGKLDKFRPENVVGSYAVYHSTKSNNIIGQKSYFTGKAFHIYRPQMEDANGWKVWGELNIDVMQGIQTVTIPQDFLDDAIYPVRHATGEELGYYNGGNPGGSNDNAVYNIYAYFSKENPGESGTVDSLHVYSKEANAGNGNVKGGLWQVTDLALVDNSISPIFVVDSATPQWWNVDYVSKPSITSQDYYVGFMAEGWQLMYKYYDDEASTGGYDNGSTYASPNNLSTPLNNTRLKISVYATYTAGGGATPIPAPTADAWWDE